MTQQSKLQIFEKYFLFFMMYALLGWLYEVFLEVVVYQWGFSNRGFLFGPYLPIYGFGALTFIICLRKLKNKKIKFAGISITPLIIFLGVMIIATAMELAASYIMEAATGAWLWDYHAYPFNFDGRIALNPSIRFGIGGTFFIYLVQPFFEKLIKRLNAFQLHLCFAALFIIFIADAATRILTL